MKVSAPEVFNKVLMSAAVPVSVTDDEPLPEMLTPELDATCKVPLLKLNTLVKDSPLPSGSEMPQLGLAPGAALSTKGEAPSVVKLAVGMLLIGASLTGVMSRLALPATVALVLALHVDWVSLATPFM